MCTAATVATIPTGPVKEEFVSGRAKSAGQLWLRLGRTPFEVKELPARIAVEVIVVLLA